MGLSASGTGHAGGSFLLAFQEDDMLTGSLLWLIGVPIPIIILVWFFFLRGR